MNAPEITDSWAVTKQITGGSAGAVIQKTGAGTISLNPATGSTFVGSVNVSGGKLYVGNANFTGAPAVTVAAGATFGGSGTAGNITVGDGGTLEGNPTGSAALTAGDVIIGSTPTTSTTLKGTLSAGSPALTVNNLTINGGSQKLEILASGAGLVNGTTYDLVVSNNAITAPNAPSVLAALKSTARSHTPIIDATGKKIQMYYDANATIYWTGAASGAWGTAGANWKLSGNNSNTLFLANDAVFFHDNPARDTVDIANADVTPTATTFDNTTATEYTIESSGMFGITTGSITKNNNGTVILTNSNLTNGPVALNGGNVVLWYEDSLGTGSIAFNGGQLTYDGPDAAWTRNFNVGAGGARVAVTGNAGTLSQTGSLSGIGSFTKTGPGILALGGDNSAWTNGFTISQGKLQMAPSASNAFGSGPIILGDADSGEEVVELSFQGLSVNTNIGPITVTNHGAGTAIYATLNPVGANSNPTIPTLTLEKQVILRSGESAPGGRGCDLSFGTITGVGAGAGNDSIVVEGMGATVRTSVPDAGAGNNFTGNIRVASGTWQMQNRTYLDYSPENSNLIVPDTSSVTVDAGASWAVTHTLNETIDALNGGGTVRNGYSTQVSTVTLGAGNGNGDFSGVIQGGSGGLGLHKLGTGTQILSGSNTYGGGTMIESGALVINNTEGSATGTGAVNVQAGARLAGTGISSGETTVAVGATVAPGGNSAGTLTLGSAIISGAYPCQIDGASGDRLTITGALTVDPFTTITITTLAAPTEPSYTILSYGSLVGTLPTITPPSGYTVDTSTPGVVRIVNGTGYDSWISGFASLTDPNDRLQGADPDHDGMSNVLEFVTNGDPTNSNIANRPTMVTSGSNIVFTFTRRDDAESLNPTVVFDADLAGAWTTAQDGVNATIVVTENDANPDTVQVTIPKGGNPSLFAKLQVAP